MENIRSYSSADLELPLGKVLLSGNIGSGKSTVLLAIDFALFGLQRTELAGASLLRNGAEEGSVELHFEIGDNKYLIKRGLKRKDSGVVQDTGYFIKNGVKEEKTAIELKQIILELLNYPKDLITKNKSLIYKYTVYTPQEEMKAILSSPKEERLDTLRKVFGVDKYKRIKENVKVLNTKLREIKKEYEGMIFDLQEKIIEKERKEKEKVVLDEEIFKMNPKIEEANKSLIRKREEILAVEEQKEEALRINKEVALLEQALRHKISEKERIQELIEKLGREVLELEAENLELKEDIKESIKAVDTRIILKEKENREILNLIQELKTKKMHSTQIKIKIESLNNCPTCYQEVSLDYKKKITDKCYEEIKSFEENILNEEKKSKEVETEIRQLRLDLDLFKRKEGEINLIKLKMQQREKKKEELNATKENLLKNLVEVNEYQIKLNETRTRLETLKGIGEVYQRLKKELDEINIQFNRLNIEKNGLEISRKHIEIMINKINEEIQKKITIREKKEKINQIQFWLTEKFSPMMDTMEKNILYSVHSEFNSLFERWFSLLIENNVLQMRLDEEYSPKIIQNGYDIEYEYLSGGEKTAGALAYRLALNQVINDLNTGIKTKDLLILDEPTDGFSSEQLERLKVLMEEIKIPQIIIVSHEAQVESFVDSIIRFEKQNHQTRVY